MPYIQDPNDATRIMKVDENGRGLVNLPTDAAYAGYVKLLDSNGNPILTTENGALDTSQDTIILFEQVDGAALNTNVWTTTADTQTVAQANGFITLNSGNITTPNKYSMLTSVKTIPMYGYLPLKTSLNVKTPIQPTSNLVQELGLIAATAMNAPTDGCFFRWNSAAQFLAVINNNGQETTQVIANPPANNDVALFDIITVEDRVQFFINDVEVADIEVPTAQAFPTNAGRLPICLRTYTTGSTPSSAPQLNLGQALVVQQAMDQNKTWPETLAVLGRGAYQSPTAYTQTANHANSTSPVSATLSNITPSYNTPGGRFQFASILGAVTDYALFGYLVPAGYQLSIYRIAISCANTGAAGSVTVPTILDWGIGLNASLPSLATADAAGPPQVYAPRRIPLGMQAFPTTALLGAQPPDLVRQFDVPLVVDGGRYLHIILQVPVGAATASQVIRGDAMINGVFE